MLQTTFTPDFHEAHQAEWENEQENEQKTLRQLAEEDALETWLKAQGDCIQNYNPDAGDDDGQEQDMLEQGKVDDLLQMYWGMMDF
jgi:hypothetical protein